MNKYDSLKYWARVKARVPHRCQKCGAAINKGVFYYKEKVNFVNHPLGFHYGELCQKCGTETGKSPQ